MTAPSATAATLHWVDALVIGHQLCPFAAAARRGLVVTEVAAGPGHASVDEAVLHALVDAATILDRTPLDTPATTLLVVPRGLEAFDAFLAVVDAADAVLDALGLRGRIQLAHFHPDYRFEGEDPDDASVWTNRAPHPTLHLIREADVADAVARHPDPQGIPARNVAHLRALGVDAVRALAWGDHAPSTGSRPPTT